MNTTHKTFNSPPHKGSGEGFYSQYFTLRELTSSSVALQHKLQNIPNDNQLANLQALVTNVLDPLRALYGSPLYVNSAFRSVEVNAAVGGVANSQHTKGQAADITTGSLDGNRRLLGLILAHGPSPTTHPQSLTKGGELILFDQLIAEHCDRYGRPRWIHISFVPKGRGEVFFN